MFEHRLISPTRIEFQAFDPPFSSFRYVESNYPGDNPAIKRLFSLARSHSARTLMTEEIPPAGVILDENDEVGRYYSDFRAAGLKRISFWKTKPAVLQEGHRRADDCVGYAILKRDQCPSIGCDRWHVFEAVFKKYDHTHNCVPNPNDYEVNLGGATTPVKVSCSRSRTD